MTYFHQLLEGFFKNTTKIYLIVANVVLAFFAIWFSNVGILPFKNVGDFTFFAVLALILALYRPGWTFLFLIGTLALENINLAPKVLGLTLRPYQFFALITMIALLVQFISRRLTFKLPRLYWYDTLPVIFALAGFMSSLGATNKAASFKQSIVASSFVALYFLVRIYVQSLDDAKRVVPFFLSGGLIVILYAIWQNVRFLVGKNSFEVMAGRPNATFTEADWLGIYLVFLLAMILTIIFHRNKKTRNSDFQFPNLNHAFVTLIFVALILTVSRSAWVGAVAVILVFLKLTLLGHYGKDDHTIVNKYGRFWKTLKIKNWQWKEAGLQSLYLAISLEIGLLAVMNVPLTRFQLADRAVSTGGSQKITIACYSNMANVLPDKIGNVDELEKYGCKHINLEDVDSEKSQGHEVSEILRVDPTVNIRADIYRRSIAEIKAHPIFGIGWGSISQILGTDERGAGLNASDIFLEIWLGSGLLGFIFFIILLGYILFFSIGAFLDDERENITTIVFVMLGWTAVVVPNLFNSGIFLGFVWVYMAIAVSLSLEKR